MIAKSPRNGDKLLLCGNGGSGADCQHISAEFTGRLVKDRPPISAISLITDTSALTCICNYYAFNEVFSPKVFALGRQEDTLLVITTSGNSGNVLSALDAAKELGFHTIGLLGRDVSKARQVCTHSIVVSSNVTARIQEAHILIGHTICGVVENELGLL